jgi:hypothetical protein
MRRRREYDDDEKNKKNQDTRQTWTERHTTTHNPKQQQQERKKKKKTKQQQQQPLLYQIGTKISRFPNRIYCGLSLSLSYNVKNAWQYNTLFSLLVVIVERLYVRWKERDLVLVVEEIQKMKV